MLARFGKLAALVLDFFEQPHVLDCDHCLVGEGGHQLDLLVAKRLRHGFRHEKYADDLSFAQEWRTKRRPIATNLLRTAPGVLFVQQHIGNVNNSTFERSSPSDATAIHGHRPVLEIVPDSCVHLGCVTETSSPAEDFTVALEQPGMISIAKPDS